MSASVKCSKLFKTTRSDYDVIRIPDAGCEVGMRREFVDG